MKKVLSVILLIVIVMACATNVKAIASSELSSRLYSIGAKYGMTQSDKIKIDRYLADYPITSAKADQVLAKAEEVANIMENAGVTDIRDLMPEQKEQVQEIANEAASIVGVTLTYVSGVIDVYKDGKLIEVLGVSGGKLAYTGNNVNVLLIVSTVAILALTTFFVAERKLANV